MIQTIEAIYEAGTLRLLQPIALSEGQRVTLAIETRDEAESVRAALGDLVVHWPDTSNDSDATLKRWLTRLTVLFKAINRFHSSLLKRVRSDESLLLGQQRPHQTLSH